MLLQHSWISSEWLVQWWLEQDLKACLGTVYIENDAIVYNYDDQQVCTENISEVIIFKTNVVKEMADESQDFSSKAEKSKRVHIVLLNGEITLTAVLTFDDSRSN